MGRVLFCLIPDCRATRANDETEEEWDGEREEFEPRPDSGSTLRNFSAARSIRLHPAYRRSETRGCDPAGIVV